MRVINEIDRVSHQNRLRRLPYVNCVRELKDFHQQTPVVPRCAVPVMASYHQFGVFKEIGGPDPT